MPTYSNRDELRDRLTRSGYRFVADRDGDGQSSEKEQLSHIDTALAYADAQVNAAISTRYEINSGSTSSLLRFIAVDIAACRAWENGGLAVPKSLRRARERAEEQLEDIMHGKIEIPEATVRTNDGQAISGSLPKAISTGIKDRGY